MTNRQFALLAAIETFGKTSNINNNQGDWIINIAKQYEEYLSINANEFYNVYLKSCGNILDTIKTIQNISGISELLAREIVTSKNIEKIKDNVSKEDASIIKNHIESIGGSVYIERS